jgi:glycerol-3-phosphate dehydrogenase
MWAAGVFYRNFYSMISGQATKAETVSRAQADSLAPAISGSAQHGAFVWQDALLSDPLRFAEALKERLRGGGIEVREKSPVQAVCRTAEGYEIKPYGITSRSVISALGPWMGSVHLEGIHLSDAALPTGWCKAFNLILNRRLCGEAAFAVHAAQGRMFFFVSRDSGFTALGTWYEPWIGAPEQGQPTETEIMRFLDACNDALPSLALRRQDVAQVEWGILPMRGVSANGPKLYGSHKMAGSGHYVEVMSTKYTTFLSQGRELVKRVSRD